MDRIADAWYRAPIQRTSSASELSKGALRALKADARHPSIDSGDWSDLYSRDASIDPDYDGSAENGGFDGQNEQVLQGMPQFQHPPNGQFNEGMAYVHPALGGWNFPQIEQQPVEQFGDWQCGEFDAIGTS